ncbi:MAG: DotU family type IV/VI secretion system protein [Bryobacteraceae bacterium]
MPNNEQGRPLAPSSPDNLALQLQELFTAIVRLRARRQQVSNAELFRGQVLNSIKTAEQAARASGYTDADIRLAVFAVVAFLDESLLNLRQAVFNDWVRRPLQEEMFGRHVGGEVFFDHLQELLERRDSVEVADVLEVFYLCLLLGYLGRFSISSKGDLQALMQRTSDKIGRIRKSGPDLSPQWALPPEAARQLRSDPWMRRLLVGAAISAAVALLLFPVFRLSLASEVNAIGQISSPGGP